MGLEIFYEPFHGEGGGDGGGEDAYDEGDGAVVIPHELRSAEPYIVGGACIAEFPDGFFGGGCGESNDAEEEGVFDCGFDGKAHEEAGAYCHEGARGAWPHGHALKDADEERHLPSEFEDIAAIATWRILPAIFYRPKDSEASGDPCEDDWPEAEEFFLDDIVQQEAEHGGGEESNDDGNGEFEAIGILAADAFDHFPDMFVIEPEDCEDSSALDTDGEAVCCEFIDFAKCADVHQPLGDDEVTRGGNGEIFCDAFDEAE